jgi:hypothetical protein
VAECDADAIFRDLESIPLGTSFRRHLANSLSKCSAMLAIIGPQWLTIQDTHGVRRLDDPDDLVRLEIETALTRGIPVIPVLVGGTVVPKKSTVPDGIALISEQQAIVIRQGLDFDRDMERLIEQLRAGGHLRVRRSQSEVDHPFGLLGMP